MAENKSCLNEVFCEEALDQLRLKDILIENLQKELAKVEKENEEAGLALLRENDDCITVKR